MAWIKRNLLFVIGASVALILLIVAGVFLFSNYSDNASELDKYNAKIDQLVDLQKQKPHPGDGRKTDNIKQTQQQQASVEEVIANMQGRFARIPAIPSTPRVRPQEFTAKLRQTVDQLQRDARASSVQVSSNYAFSFTMIMNKVSFREESLQTLAAQLGEVKAICDLLIRTRINALESIKREKSCPEDDPAQAPNDYGIRQSVTNEWAVITPYEIVIRGFSTELASVMSSFSSSSNAIVVRAVNVEPATSQNLADPNAVVPGGPEGGMPQRFYRGMPQPVMQPVAAAPMRGGLQTVINEHVCRITLYVDVVKLKSMTSDEPRPRQVRPKKNRENP
jgi:hypothetical protein